MKKIVLLFAAIIVLFSACKEDHIDSQPLASLNVANVVVNGETAMLNDYLRDNCGSMSTKKFTFRAGSARTIKLFPSSSPNAPYYNEVRDIELGGIYSIFLTGTSSSPEAIFVRDNIPPYPREEVMNIRIANMSPGSGPLDVTLASAPSIKKINAVNFKQVSEFITLPLPATVPTGTNVFQIRDNLGTILASYAAPASARHRNTTLVVKGLIGGSGANALAVLAMPNY